MAGTSKISAVFDANTTGFVAGTRQVSAALSKLEKDVAGMRSSLGTLSAIQGTQLFLTLGGLAKSAASSLFDMAKGAAQSVDVLSKLADRAGLAYEEMAGLQYAGDLAGVGVDAIATALTKADKVFVAAGQGSSQAASALASIGLSFEQLQGKTSSERFEAIAEALSKMPNTAERTAAAIALFGKSGAGLLPMFNEGAEGLRKMQAEAKAFGLGLTSLQGKDVEAMNDSFTRAGAAIQGIVTQVTAQLAPGIAGVVNMFADFVRDSEGASLGKKIADSLYDGAEFLASVADAFVAQTGQLWDYAKAAFDVFEVASSVFSAAIKVADTVFQSFKAIGNGIGATLSYAVQKMTEAAANIASIIPGGGSWERNLREMSRAAAADNERYLQAAQVNASAAVRSAGELLGVNVGQAAEEAARPTVGALQALVREGRRIRDESATATDDQTKKAAREVKIEVEKAVGGVKIAAGTDWNTTEGYAEFLRLKFGGGANDTEERIAEATERNADATEDVAAKLDFRVVSLV